MELEYSPSRFEVLHKIGEGVHGVVMKAIDLECNNKLVAIKRVALRNKYGSIATNTIREIKSLQQCDNENVSLVEKERNACRKCWPKEFDSAAEAP